VENIIPRNINLKTSEQIFKYESLKDENISQELILEPNQSLNLKYILVCKKCTKNLSISFLHSQNSNVSITINCVVEQKSKINIELKNTISKESLNCFVDQQINGIVLENESSIHVCPIMQISNNKILASHSINIGCVDNEMLFYLINKGFDKEQATKFIISNLIE
jgi:hypothetical protein